VDSVRPRLAISFSGGRTSAVMTKLCLAKYGPTHDIIVTFANTGCEHPSTLKFVKNCDDVFLFKTVWIEAEVTHGERVGIRPRIVTHDTASRNGEPFEEYIKKYGIPNAGSPQCTSRLKTEAMEYYIRKVRGWDVGTYKTAIGIRADEMDRVSSKKDEYGFVYPLVDMGWTKAMVKAECRRWPFDLQIPGDHFGNCTWCWKKSLRKLLTVATEAPSEFDFPARMEATYGTHKAENAKGRRVFFRGDRSTLDILELAKQPFTPYTEATKFRQQTLWDDILDVGGGCGESCEIGADQ
jgi:hypothetical protein